MAFRMSEQPRTIKIYNLLAGTNEFIGEGDAYIPLIQVLPANQYRYCTARYSGRLRGCFSTVMRHRGISLRSSG
ncbi:tail fiber chaperone; Qin prophage [Escherichia coli]|uniref:Tail fiber chaperone Qin prophage n=1 Tax=Escherichia coli TaxID=562 RepID=A0A376S6U5_ECOLX|nr:tail fiber chaperone; Qin prophage [Escherichia coli]